MARTTVQTRPNHRPNGADPSSERCPWCGSPITRAEFQRIRDQIADQERTRLSKAEQALREQFTREQREVAVKARAAVEKARKEATAYLTDKINEALAAERQRNFAERVALEQKLADLQKKLAAKPAHQIGQPAETDLYTSIRAAFSEDQVKVTRVPPGRPGPDVIVDFVDRCTVAGRVCLDSKAHSRWSARFVTKLRSDAADCGADHSILSSTILPAGCLEAGICIIEGVICTTPSKVIPLLHLLRRHLIQLASYRLGANDRIEKTGLLYEYITGAECAGLFDQMTGTTAALIELDAREAASHQITFRKRGDLIRHLQQAHGNLTATIDSIVTGTTLASR